MIIKGMSAKSRIGSEICVKQHGKERKSREVVMMKNTITVPFRQQCHAQAHLPSGPFHLHHYMMDLLTLISPTMNMTCNLQPLTSVVTKTITRFWRHLLITHPPLHQLLPQTRLPQPPAWPSVTWLALLFTPNWKSFQPLDILASGSRMLCSCSASTNMSYIE